MLLLTNLFNVHLEYSSLQSNVVTAYLDFAITWYDELSSSMNQEKKVIFKSVIYKYTCIKKFSKPSQIICTISNYLHKIIDTHWWLRINFKISKKSQILCYGFFSQWWLLYFIFGLLHIIDSLQKCSTETYAHTRCSINFLSWVKFYSYKLLVMNF